MNIVIATALALVQRHGRSIDLVFVFGLACSIVMRRIALLGLAGLERLDRPWRPVLALGLASARRALFVSALVTVWLLTLWLALARLVIGLRSRRLFAAIFRTLFALSSGFTLATTLRRLVA